MKFTSNGFAELDMETIQENIKREINPLWKEMFLVNNSLEEDLEMYQVDLDKVLAAFIRISFGEVFSAGYPTAIISKDSIIFDEMIIFDKPTAVQIFCALIVSWEENGEFREDAFRPF